MPEREPPFIPANSNWQFFNVDPPLEFILNIGSLPTYQENKICSEWMQSVVKDKTVCLLCGGPISIKPPYDENKWPSLFGWTNVQLTKKKSGARIITLCKKCADPFGGFEKAAQRMIDALNTLAETGGRTLGPLHKAPERQQ